MWLKKYPVVFFLIIFLSIGLLYTNIINVQIFDNQNLSIDIIRVVKKPVLEYYEEKIIYTGLSETNSLTVEAKKDHTFILIDLNITNENEFDKKFNTKNIDLNIEGVIYSQIKKTEPIEKFGYNEINSSIYPNSSNRGYILFEIPIQESTKDYTNWNLLVNDNLISFNSVSDSEIPIVKNIAEEQLDKEKFILSEYNAQEYTIEDPYIIVNPYGNAPLVALSLFETEEETKINVRVKGKNNNDDIEYEIKEYNKSHEIPIIGLYSDSNNIIELIASKRNGEQKIYKLNIKTESISEIIKDKGIEIVKEDLSNQQGNLIFTIDSNRTIIDNKGNIRWLLTNVNGEEIDSSGVEEFLDNGRFLLSTNSYENFANIYEIDWLGKVHWNFSMQSTAHHDAEELDNGNILVASTEYIYEIERYQNKIIRTIDLREIFPVEKKSLEFRGDESDWFHINSLEFNSEDSSLIVSSRNQHSVIKFSYPDFSIRWILSPNENELLSEKYLRSNGELEWFYSQHQPVTLPDIDNNANTIDIVLFDNGVHRSILKEKKLIESEMYSRIIHYRINEIENTVTQIFEFGKEEGLDFYSDIQSGVQFLEESGNYFATFDSGNLASWSESIQNSNKGIKSHIVEINSSGEKIFQIDMKNLYRSYKKSSSVFGTGYSRLGEELQYSIVPVEPIDIKYDIYTDDVEYNINNISIIGGYLNIDGFMFFNENKELISDLYLILESANEKYTYKLLRSNTILIPNSVIDSNQKNNKGFEMKNINLNNLNSGEYYLKVGVLNSESKKIAIEDTGYRYMKYDSLSEKQMILKNNIQLKVEELNPTIDNPIVIKDPYDISPLTALVVFNTEEKKKINIKIKGKDDAQDIEHQFTTYNTMHEIPIYGLYPNFRNIVEITSENRKGEKETIEIKIVTDPLPSDFQKISIDQIQREKVEDGFIFIVGAISNSIYPAAIDIDGNVRWYLIEKNLGTAGPIRKISNGNLILSSDEEFIPPYYSNGFYEINFLGEIIQQHKVKEFHHDVVELPNGDFIALANNPDDSSSVEDYIVQIDGNTNEIIKTWDMKKILGLTISADANYSEFGEHDWLHLNSIDYSEKDNAIIVSARHQDAIIKFNKDTNEILWIISDYNDEWPKNLEEKLLIPIESDFIFNYGQHAVKELDNGDIIIFDNGNFKSKLPKDKVNVNSNYSRLLRLKIDIDNRTIETIYEYGEERGSDLFSSFVGDVDVINDSYLITFGGIVKDKNTSYEGPSDLLNKENKDVYGESVIIELLGNQVVFEMKITNGKYGNIYRSEKIKMYEGE